MWKKIINLTVLSLVLTLLTTGCWDSVDINKKNIFTTVILDKKDEEYIFYIEIANTDAAKQSNGGDVKPYVSIKARGKTIVEARDSLERQMDQPIYLGAVRALVLTENVSNEDVTEYFNRLRADAQYRKKVLTVITSDKPEDILKISNNGESTGFYIEEMLDNLVNMGNSFYRPTARFIENSSSDVNNFLIPNICMNEKNLELNGYSVVKNNKTIGMISAEESKGLIYMKTDNAKWTYNVPYENGQYIIEVELNGKKTKPYYDNGVISFDLSFDFHAQLQYSDQKCACNVGDDLLNGLKQTLQATIEKELTQTVFLSQQYYACDYLSFDDEFHIKYPEIFHQLNWNETYPTVQVKINTKLELEHQDMMDYSPHGVE